MEQSLGWTLLMYVIRFSSLTIMRANPTVFAAYHHGRTPEEGAKLLFDEKQRRNLGTIGSGSSQVLGLQKGLKKAIYIPNSMGFTNKHSHIR